MIGRFVADASMAIAWVHPGQADDDSSTWLAHVANGAVLVVPSLWPLEITNALLVLQRRRKITASERDEALNLLNAIPVTIDHGGADRAFRELSALAHAEGLSVYDAAYLDLSIRLRLPLACKDGPLSSAASRRRVRVRP